MNELSASNSDLQNELNYYKKKLDELSGESIRHDYAMSSVRFELKQKKDAFSILSNLQREFLVTTPDSAIFNTTAKAINTYLGMDRSLVLTSAENNIFRPAYWYNFPDEQISSLVNHEIKITSNVLKPGGYFLVSKATEPDETCRQIQQLFSLNYFIGVPVYDNNLTAILIAGRQFEKVPFYQPLNKSDADTLLAIASLIEMIFQNKKMVALEAEMIKQKNENSLISSMLAELRATQAQLIHSAKMASLGELTAGIAHEIQNPLNFVNNFSEVNKELLVEMKGEIDKGNIHEAKEIANDVIDNHDKINHHGRKADAIVKSMLHHSQTSSGKKDITDINALADEYLRLAYHGMRARDKSFSSKIETHFDPSLKNVNVVPQDIGRVFLNLINNALYAVSEKQRQNLNGHMTGGQGYEPTVTVTTQNLSDKIEINVKDNGNGIPQKIRDKIFQPFFTTKPTGQGTGLGLSLSYDIVKAHSGEIKVTTKEGEGSEFIVQLPGI